MDMEIAKTLLMAFVRRFDFGTEFEDTINRLGQQQGKQDKPDPKEQEAAQKMQLESAKLELKKQELQTDVAIKQAELALKAAELEQKGEIENAKILQKYHDSLMNLEVVKVNAGGGRAN